jgi:transcriptional regulator with XRE-family HTH domain
MSKGGDIVYEDEFPLRLAQLRNKKGVSARDMSLSIGQNHAYINNIESGKALPSMAIFFYICEYLNITPAEFFDLNSKNPEKLQSLIEDLKKLDDKQLESIAEIVKGLAK